MRDFSVGFGVVAIFLSKQKYYRAFRLNATTSNMRLEAFRFGLALCRDNSFLVHKVQEAGACGV